ncbi:MAG: PH domain-containing protein [Prevotella sp.]|nr:PH domain-containing protein [Prevotella sp.]
MNKRTFEHRVSWAEIAGTAVLALVAFWFLWHRTTVNVIVGCVFAMVAVAAIDRLLHTSYIIEDGTLTISRGHLGKKKTVKLSEIDRVEKVKTLFTHYVLVEYSGMKHAAISTINEDAFIKTIEQ